jgi:predicted nucleic acid-binding protein
VKLIDTSSWIDFLRDSNQPAQARVRELMLSGEAAWCELVATELWMGARGKAEKKKLKEMQSVIPMLSIDSDVWQKAFAVARCCRENGLKVPVADVIIAACSVHYQVDLEYSDRHFDAMLPLCSKI